MNTTKHPPLDGRLALAASFIRPGSVICDVGTDHAYLPLWLLTHGVCSRAVACDINEGPLQSAMRNADKFGVRDKMSFYLSDGAKDIPRNFDALVCAGMGGDTMIHILEDAPWLRSEQYYLVLQCQSKTPMLRKYLSDTGWCIVEETIIRDGKFLYTVMEVRWRPETPRLTPGQCYITPAMLNSINHDLPEYYGRIVEGLRLAVTHQNDAEKKVILAELENTVELNWIREMLK